MDSEESKYTQIFVLPNGEEIKLIDSYMGRYFNWAIQMIYDKEHSDKDKLMSDDWKNCDCKKYEKNRNLVNIENGESYTAVETFVVAENKNWKEYKTVDYDGARCCNVKNYMKIEVLLITEKWSRRIFLDWTTGNCNFYDMLSDLSEALWVDFCEEKHFAKHFNDGDDEFIKLEFYTQRGEHDRFEFYTYKEIEELIASIRVVGFKREIID